MLLAELEEAGAELRLNSTVTDIEALEDQRFKVSDQNQSYVANKVVIACGGLSLPKIASDLASQIANKFIKLANCVSKYPQFN